VTSVQGPIAIRVAVDQDIPRLVDLVAAHADFERAPLDTTDLAGRLRATLISNVRATCLVATSDSDGIVGYTTFSPEYSTWAARDHLHMDTLFVQESFRGRGIGERLLAAIIQRASALGIARIEWQTPQWNQDAIRFYERLGATAAAKVRFTYEVSMLEPAD
jgi:GNAT superfamily N-acetyltransferase